VCGRPHTDDRGGVETLLGEPVTTHHVVLHPLTFVRDGDEVVVGRPDVESYAVFPLDGAELLRRLVDGTSPAEAAAWYERTYQEPVDVEDFLGTLRELGFAEDAPDPSAGPPPEPRLDLSAGPGAPAAAGGGSGAVRLQWLGRALFSPVAAVLYGALIAVAAVVLWRLPQLLPAPSHVFFTRSLVAVQLTLLVAELPLLFLHESAHVLAGRRLGLTSRLGIGRRLYFIVFETTLTKLLSVPRRKRYLPLLAGILADIAVFCVLVLVAAATRLPDGSVSFAGRLALALAYLTVIRVAWQFLFFLETDAQHLLATAIRVTDLRGMTAGYLRGWFWRRLRRPERAGPPPYLSVRDRAVLRWFGPLTLVASVLLTLLALTAAVPVLVHYVVRIGTGLGSGGTGADFWNAAVALLLAVAQFGVLALVTARDRRAARRAARPAARPAGQPSAQVADGSAPTVSFVSSDWSPGSAEPTP
jgi:hypothetical protein